MAHPYHHSESSARKHGGNPDDYDIYIGYRLADKADEISYNIEPIKMLLN